MQECVRVSACLKPFTVVIVGMAGQGWTLTCFVDQHLSQLLLVTRMRVVEHALPGQVKLAEQHKEERGQR